MLGAIGCCVVPDGIFGTGGSRLVGIVASVKIPSSASVEREVPAVAEFAEVDVIELPHVLPETVLESDCLGSAVLV